MEKQFIIDKEYLERLRNLINEKKYDEVELALNKLIKYTIEKYSVLTIMYQNAKTEEERLSIDKKIRTANRKFKHMLDVPALCIKRAENKEYDREKSILLTLIGILHDIGRIDEIIGLSDKEVFKGKMDHSSIGAHYLIAGDEITPKDHINDFLDKDIIKKYGYFIRDCVQNHSSLVVPESIIKTDFDRDIVKDIRLIDKSSIMNSFLYEDMSTVIGITLDELAKTHIGDATFEELTSCKSINRKKEGVIYDANRHFMSHVGFIYDMDDFSLLTPNWLELYLNMYYPDNQNDIKRKKLILDTANDYMSKY